MPATVRARPSELVIVGVRRALYPLLALPAGIAGLFMTGLGMRRVTATTQILLLRGLLDQPVSDTEDRGMSRFLALSLPVNVVAFAPAIYLWLVLVLNLGYPLRGDTTAESLRESWGGPTLAGAWAVHAAGGALVFVLIGLPVLAGVAELQGRLAHRWLSAGPF